MLKAYALEDVKPGMIIGKDVVGDGGSILIPAGTALDTVKIAMLNARSMFAVIIEENPEPAVAEEESISEAVAHFIDDRYMQCYKMLEAEVVAFFEEIKMRGKIDMARLERMTDRSYIMELCRGAKAVTQIHNMSPRGEYLERHTLRVAILAGLLAHWLKWPFEKQKELMIAAFLHDIGNLRISKDILEKKGKLTTSEFALIRKHTEYGYQIVQGSPLAGNREIMLGIYQHHERCDGSGYPQQRKGDAIAEYARILAILDSYNAMVSNRSYAKRKSPFDVFKIIYEDVLSGKLDTTFAVSFMRELSRALVGSWVSLSDGRKGCIVYLDESRVTSLPVVQIDQDTFVDLNRQTDIKLEALLNVTEVD